MLPKDRVPLTAWNDIQPHLQKLFSVVAGGASEAGLAYFHFQNLMKEWLQSRSCLRDRHTRLQPSIRSDPAQPPVEKSAAELIVFDYQRNHRNRNKDVCSQARFQPIEAGPNHAHNRQRIIVDPNRASNNAAIRAEMIHPVRI